MGSTRIRRLALVAAWLCLSLAAAPSAQSPRVVPLLDRYAAGQFREVAAIFDQTKDFGDLLKQLKRDVPAWIKAGGVADQPRRELAAATFALEAARAGELDDWKLVQKWMNLDNIYWHPPAELVEWGCALLRTNAVPRPSERLWHLAALSVADRAGDYEFLIGSPWEGRANKKDEIEHLKHSALRFPHERRFPLAQGIAAEWRLFPSGRSGAVEADKVFDTLKDDEQVGGEASLRLGFMQLRNRHSFDALVLFAAAEARTREPFVVYLARYFRGQALEQQKNVADAETAYRRALAIVPKAQSASFALSALLAVQGRRAEAAGIVDAALTASPRPIDPWRAYGEADARFWPDLIAQLHAQIHR